SWILIQSERTFVPPVTALRSPPDSRMTGALLSGDDRFVHTCDSFDDLAVAWNQISRLAIDDIAFTEFGSRHQIGLATRYNLLRQRIRLRLAQVVGLGFAPRFSHRFGKVGKEYGEPQPQRDLNTEKKAPDTCDH